MAWCLVGESLESGYLSTERSNQMWEEYCCLLLLVSSWIIWQMTVYQAVLQLEVAMFVFYYCLRIIQPSFSYNYFISHFPRSLLVTRFLLPRFLLPTFISSKSLSLFFSIYCVSYFPQILGRILPLPLLPQEKVA